MAPNGFGMINIKNLLKSFYKKFITLKGDPGKIAMGMAIGIFIGVTPLVPFHTVLIICICYLSRQNITAAYLGSWIISNPLTMPFFYYGEYCLGKKLFGLPSCHMVFNDYSFLTILQQGWKVCLPLISGGMMLAPFFAVPAYFLTYRLIIALRHRHSK
jgi:hypothetical protein